MLFSLGSIQKLRNFLQRHFKLRTILKTNLKNDGPFMANKFQPEQQLIHHNFITGFCSITRILSKETNIKN